MARIGRPATWPRPKSWAKKSPMFAPKMLARQSAAQYRCPGVGTWIFCIDPFLSAARDRALTLVRAGAVTMMSEQPAALSRPGVRPAGARIEHSIVAQIPFAGTTVTLDIEPFFAGPRLSGCTEAWAGAFLGREGAGVGRMSSHEQLCSRLAVRLSP